MRFFFVLFPCFIFSQSLVVESELDTNIANIGDVIKWSITIKEKGNKKVHFPDFPEDQKNLSTINNSLILDNKKIIGIEFEIICWDTGRFVTPNYSIDILKDNGDLDYSLEIDSSPFFISSLITSSDNIDFRPLKGPLPVTPIFPIKLIVLFVFLLLVMYLMIYIWKKRIKTKYEKAKYLFLESPKERAIKRMQSLNDIKLAKEFYTEISHISKEYFEKKYFIYVLEMTTGEILNNRSLFPMNDIYFSKWSSMLRKADLVKYAKTDVNIDRMEQDKSELYEMIKAT